MEPARVRDVPTRRCGGRGRPVRVRPGAACRARRHHHTAVVALAHGGGTGSERAVIQECQHQTQPDNSHDPAWVDGRQWLTDRDSRRGGGPGAWRDGSYRTTACADGDITYVSHGTEFNATSTGCILIWFALQNPATGNWSFSTVRSICSGGRIHLRTDAPVNWRLYVWMMPMSPNGATELPIGTLSY